jgi:2-desacetyl-2-hydroxyethyl bacteriochlorophyllide A dehydrogenase
VRALVYLGPGRMEMQDVPDPHPESGEVVIAPTASAVCGSDLHGFREASPRRIPPLIMGHETVGTIVEVGEGVPAGRAGERVVLKPIVGCGRCRWCREGAINRCSTGRLMGRDMPGGFAERVAAPANCAIPFSAALSDEVATLTEPLANAVHVVARSVTDGDSVLVVGAGPIGVLMARTALLFGAGRVFATDPVPDRLALARSQGAEPVTGDDPVEAVLDATDGTGVDVVIDAAGFGSTWAMGLRSVRIGGRIEQVGLGAGSGTVDFFAVLGKEVTIAGSFAWGDADFDRAVAMMGEAAVDATGWITTMPLADGQRAFEELVDPAAGRFKVVLVP